MLSGLTGALLGANRQAKDTYKLMTEAPSFKQPRSWADESFSLDDYDLVFLPGGHDKAIRQIIDSKRVHDLLLAYFPSIKKPSKKSLAAICHGVQVLAHAQGADGRSVIHDCKTTALPHFMEQSIFQTTRAFLGDYYKTYGSNADSVQQVVTKSLASKDQFVNSLGLSPFIVEDENYNYLSARFPPDAEKLAKRAIEVVNEVTKAS